MLCLGTLKYVTRDQFAILPMPDEVIRFLNGIAAREGYKRKPDHKAGVTDDGPDTVSEDGSDDETDDGRSMAARPAPTFMEIDGRPDAPEEEADAPEVIANPTPGDIAEYLHDAAASSQSGVNKREHEPPAVIEPMFTDGAVMDSDSTAGMATAGHPSRHTMRKRNMPSRYRAEVFHTQADADNRRMAEMDLALIADWGNEAWEHAFVISVRKAMSERREEAEPVMRAERRWWTTRTSICRLVSSTSLKHGSLPEVTCRTRACTRTKWISPRPPACSSLPQSQPTRTEPSE
jgi:hypothetical protein